MTREEEIRMASVECIKGNIDGTQIEILDTLLKALREAFILGATWSDNHPSVDCFKMPKDAEDLNLD